MRGGEGCLLSPLDQSLLTHIFTGQGQPLTLALSCGMSLADFLAWHKRPEIIQAFADYQAIQDLTTAPIAAAARRTIIVELEELIRTTPDPIEKRRAAATLLRAINPPRPPRPRMTPDRERGGTESSHSASHAAQRGTVPSGRCSAESSRPRSSSDGTSPIAADDFFSLLNPDGTIDRARLNALADQIDAEDDQDLDDEDDDVDDSTDESDPADESSAPAFNRAVRRRRIRERSAIPVAPATAARTPSLSPTPCPEKSGRIAKPAELPARPSAAPIAPVPTPSRLSAPAAFSTINFPFDDLLPTSLRPARSSTNPSALLARAGACVSAAP